MSRPLRLDTQEDRRQRYSFIETPLEMHAAPQFPDTSPRPATASHAQESGIVQQQQHTTHDVSHQQAHRYSSNEKERKFQDEGIIPTYSRVPPLEQHPALYAPVVEDLQQPECVQSPHFSRSFSSPPPGSPVPRTVKKDPESPKRSETTAIAPDANPLQSPKSPYFPPPARTTQQAPAIDDWSASHQPGQVMHPDQEVRGGTWSHGLCDCCSNIGVCCLGAICPCILYGKTQYRLSMKSRKESPTNMLGYETCNGSCAAMALLCGCQCGSKLLLSVRCVVNIYTDSNARALGYHPTHADKKGVRDQGRRCVGLCPGDVLHMLHFDTG